MRQRPPDGRWAEITLEASAACAEAAAEILRDLRAGGLVEAEAPPGRCRLRCYLPISTASPVVLRGVRTRVRGLAAFGLAPGRVRVTRRAVAGRRWATAWRRHARAVRVGRLVIRPPWLRTPAGRDRVTVEIDPGMAFGTGLHPSTRLTLRALLARLGRARPSRRLVGRQTAAGRPPAAERRAADGEQGRPRAGGSVVFDIGTGSGILAIAAARLGAPRVWAVDEDPVAVAVARENARRNRVAGRVRVARRVGFAGAPGRANLIVANIVADTIIALLPGAGARLAPGGVFVGSGIVAGRVAEVRRAARRAGLAVRRVLAGGEWRAVICSIGSTAASAPRRPRSRRRPRRSPVPRPPSPGATGAACSRAAHAGAS